MTKTITEQYAASYHVYEDLRVRIEALVRDLLKLQGIKIQVVESRTKTPKSLEDKISRPSKDYSNNLTEITDLVGLRIIVYYNDDIERVIELLTKEFTLHELLRGHDTSTIEPDKFGYLSTHMILSVSNNRSTLPEWKNINNLKFEVQIRTVIQHAWAAISHALQYKRESDIPKVLRRKLNRVAGIFEIADNEFVSIRSQTDKLREQEKRKVSLGKTDVPLSVNSILSFLENWDGLGDLLSSAINAGFTITEDSDLDLDLAYIEDTSLLGYSYLSELVDMAEEAGINTISSLKVIVENNSSDYFSELMQMSSKDSESWDVSQEFLLLLQFMRAIVEKIDSSMLKGWDESIASRTLKMANKYKIES